MIITLDTEPWAEWRVTHSPFCPQAENQGPLSCGFPNIHILIHASSGQIEQDSQQTDKYTYTL